MSNLCVFYVYLLENLDYVAPIAGLHPMFYDVMNPYFDFQTLILLVAMKFFIFKLHQNSCAYCAFVTLLFVFY